MRKTYLRETYKVKPVTTSRCAHCQYFDPTKSSGDKLYYCIKAEKYIKNLNDRPDWCPLAGKEDNKDIGPFYVAKSVGGFGNQKNYSVKNDIPGWDTEKKYLAGPFSNREEAKAYVEEQKAAIGTTEDNKLSFRIMSAEAAEKQGLMFEPEWKEAEDGTITESIKDSWRDIPLSDLPNLQTTVHQREAGSYRRKEWSFDNEKMKTSKSCFKK